MLAIAAAAQLGAASPSPFPRIPPYLPVAQGSAVIMLTGSTNTTGYRIVVAESGAAEYVSAAGRAQGTVPASVVATFFRDVRSGSPLAQLKEGSCMKSASFGTALFVYWNHSRSPDLTCTSGAGDAVATDTQAVASSLGLSRTAIGHGLVRPALPNEHHIPVPTTTP